MSAENPENTEHKSSAFEDITKLAPLAQAWFTAVHRQYNAARSMVNAEWSLMKRSVLMMIMMLIILCGFITASIVLLNVSVGYALHQFGLHLIWISLLLLSLNALVGVVCFILTRRLSRHVNLNTSISIIKGANQHIEAQTNHD